VTARRHRDDGLRAALVDARAGVRDERLAALLVDHWRSTLEHHPLLATTLGVHELDHLLTDNSVAGIEACRDQRRALLERARSIPKSALSASEALTLAQLVDELETTVAVDGWAFEEWTIDPRYSNPVIRHSYLPEIHRVRSPADAANLLARYRLIPRAIDNDVALLAIGADKGLFATCESTRRVVDLVRRQLAQPLDRWPLLQPARAEMHGLAEELTMVVQCEIAPALERYRQFVEDRLLPQGRSDPEAGLCALPDGEARYRARVRQATTLDLDPAEVHALGRAHIAASDEAIAALGARLFGASSLGETLARLRGARSLYFDSAEAIEAAAVRAVARARAALPRYLGRLPRAECVVRRIPDHEAPHATIAYYRRPHADGSKPGEYFVNVVAPEQSARYEACALAMHEAIPGHHVQIAIAQELAELPAFRRYSGATSYVEGWALYAERLADEMGLYESDLDRMGMLSFDAWRSARLVVDTGIHALGWSRAQARSYLEEHTALALANIDNEIDRYINWPGQALAYKIGQLEILSLRQRAEKALGEGFSLPAFHDAVLSMGAASLPILRRRIETWLGVRSGRHDAF
jgi:uncharacterized protein (DUF885 family)